MIARHNVLAIAIAGALAVAPLLLPRLAAGQPADKPTPDPDNGARIYFSGISGRDGPVMYTGGPDFGGMMMGMMNFRLTCASCHGPEGRGGIHAMHMYVMKAPDIRYGALNAMPEMHGRDHPYDVHDFREAVAAGRHPDGEKLTRDMPRWQMSEADFRDLFAFLKGLPQ